MLPSVRYDLLEAALIPDQPWQALDPLAVRLRTACMENVAEDVSFIQTATRPINIVNAAIKKGIDIPEAKELDELPLDDLKAEEGAMLASVVRDIEHEFHAALQEGDAKRIVASLKDLQTPINSFFDATMVMVDEERIRDARLALLNYINGMLYRAGDFTRIVIEGE
jgi:glycyl-tRNA synthetase beta chain